jgi:hypothetical protein
VRTQRGPAPRCHGGCYCFVARDWPGDQATPCLQSQFGRCWDLRVWGTAQVGPGSCLSVVVRSGPFRTAVNGTRVARLARLTSVSGGAVGSQLGPPWGPPVVTVTSLPSRERGAAVSPGLALTGRPAGAVRCFGRGREHQGAARAVRRRHLGTRKAGQPAELLEGRAERPALQHSPGF